MDGKSKISGEKGVYAYESAEFTGTFGASHNVPQV
jgi:hypothetical protein